MHTFFQAITVHDDRKCGKSVHRKTKKYDLRQPPRLEDGAERRRLARPRNVHAGPRRPLPPPAHSNVRQCCQPALPTPTSETEKLNSKFSVCDVCGTTTFARLFCFLFYLCEVSQYRQLRYLRSGGRGEAFREKM